MLSLLTFLVTAAVVTASPFPMPQGITMAMSPSGAAPSGCSVDYSGSFGIVVMNMTGSAGALATQSAE